MGKQAAKFTFPTLKYLIPLLGILIACYFIYQKFFSQKSLGEKVFSQIENGKLFYASTSGALFDIQLTTSDVIAKHILLGSGSKATIEEIMKFRSQIFEIPQSVRKHNLISSSSDTASYLFNVVVSDSDYNAYWKSTYKTYGEYITGMQKLHSADQFVRLDTLEQQLLYKKLFNEIRLKYNVETPTQDYFMEMVFIDKKLAAIFSTKK